MELEKKILELRDLGYGAGGIAKILKKDISVIRRRLYKILGRRDPSVKGIPYTQVLKMANRLSEGKTLKEIHKEFPYSTRKINEKLAPLFCPKEKEIDLQVVEMYKRGFSQKAVAKAFKLSFWKTTKYLAEHGLVNEKGVGWKKEVRRSKKIEETGAGIDPFYLTRGRITYSTSTYYC